ncbi:hypothetical protein SY83_18250 [Paenibacillus swuensis]|uniref:Dynamin N-terminal domain-containing protein n=1 Tax=Paenibacillus swuensis TaxID=1178515 RepID=A0A172TLG5_9BACL|nr:dynamin family protein [Paenibacillus swuensis]ANE47909.1 hypothetical protein SY83_18250 [Paenibacillus swuensis]
MAAQLTTTPLQQSLIQLQRVMLDADDRVHADKIEQLLHKLNSEPLAVAFCGHFSAGKSTMVNRLCGAELLPSSPIPTSANLVTIRSGEAEAQVRRHTTGYGSIVHSVPLEQLESYCKNGEDIEAVEIHYPVPLLGERMMFLDTPGIDSTDDAHKLATESALHLADVVFYVMDYNHVQSEVNFEFTKQLQDWGKPLYLIVNQIDKHSEDELRFEDYIKSVEEAFAGWNIHPNGILFTSLRDLSHMHNDWERLVWLLEELKTKGEQLRMFSMERSAAHLIGEHGKLLESRNIGLKQRLLLEVGNLSEAKAEMKAVEKAEFQLNELAQQPSQMGQRWKREMSLILDNANLTPASTRELAEAYLESRKPGFKTGLFFASGKTASEKERRENAFYQDVLKQVTANVDWHMRDWLRKSSEEASVAYEDYLTLLDEARDEVTVAKLADLIQTGASFTSEYTMTYSRKLSDDMKGVYRKAGMEILEHLIRHTEDHVEAELKAERLRLDSLRTQLEAYQRLHDLEKREQAYVKTLLDDNRLHPTPSMNVLTLPDLGLFMKKAQQTGADSWKEAVTGGTQAAPVDFTVAADTGIADRTDDATDQTQIRERLDETVQKLNRAGELIDGITSMGSLARSMREKSAQLRDNRFTIALFGAFSAGKSSFANALVGERVLPVSPNPTTAAINKIVPPVVGFPHGTAKVKLKTREAVLDDVRFSLETLGYQASDTQDWLRTIARLTPDRLTPRGKPHYAFLKAVERGWQAAEKQLGMELRTETLPDFEAYVALEEQSCFVEWIELHYDCALTRQGIVLVDTPGADSINARHTGVAFNYIKNADAILFVTYYNHAFSQADREFLLQLGRVKESFELDKMFFIVNAADLAASQEELTGVVTHVKDNLLQYGIRKPRIFPLSSKLGVQAKTADDESLISRSGLSAFERAFYAFAFGELASLAVGAAEAEIRRGATRLGQWLDDARIGDDARQSKLAALSEARAGGERLLAELSGRSRERELRQEVGELLHYVKQRAVFRFGGFYNAAFNPASLQDDGRDRKQALRASWKELSRSISYDLSQEVLATTLRIENFLNREAEGLYTEFARLLEQQMEGFHAEPYAPQAFATPAVEESLPDSPDVEKVLLEHFRNAKQFFEGAGKERLKAELETILMSMLDAFTERHQLLLMDAYHGQLQRTIASLAEQQLREWNEYAQGMQESLEMKLDLPDILSRHRELIALSKPL